MEKCTSCEEPIELYDDVWIHGDPYHSLCAPEAKTKVDFLLDELDDDRTVIFFDD